MTFAARKKPLSETAQWLFFTSNTEGVSFEF